VTIPVKYSRASGRSRRQAVLPDDRNPKYNENRTANVIKVAAYLKNKFNFNNLDGKFGLGGTTNSARGINRICTALRERKTTKPTGCEHSKMSAYRRRSIPRGRVGECIR
jgi:hypothetical protein